MLAVPANAQLDTSVALLDCRSTSWDSDKDGHAEVWQFCATAQCGCMCPVVGGILQVTADGQERNYAAWVSCQDAYGTSSEPAPDGATVGAKFTPFASPEIIVMD